MIASLLFCEELGLIYLNHKPAMEKVAFSLVGHLHKAATLSIISHHHVRLIRLKMLQHNYITNFLMLCHE